MAAAELHVCPVLWVAVVVVSVLALHMSVLAFEVSIEMSESGY